VSYYILQNRSIKDPNSRDSELAQLNQRDLSNLSEFTDLSRLTLVAETTRGSSQLRTLSLRELSDPVLLRLSLLPAMAHENVRVHVTANNGTEIILENARVYSNQGGQDVRVLLPRSKLAVGIYAVEITEKLATTDGATYRFQIEP
jgi:hypothetical protein